MGVVYRARRDGSDADIALKVIAAGEEASPEALARFQCEARIATSSPRTSSWMRRTSRISPILD
jgi:serine/threonine protein kinase